MSLKRKLTGSVLLCALMAAIVGMAITFSAFTATTDNSGNDFAAGTVVLSDNDSGTKLISMAEMAPGTTQTKCLTVRYTGSLDAYVSMYGATTSTTTDSLAPYLDVKVTRGKFAAGFTPTGFDCGTDADFVAGAVVYDGTLEGLPGNYADGLETPAKPTWVKDDSNVYKVTVTLQDDNLAQGLDATTKLTFEAHDKKSAL
jgi:hypothetical protein